MMKKFLKESKGITLISLSIAVIIILIITSAIIYSLTANLGIQKLRNLQTDIENLREKVSEYYAQYGDIPARKDVEYTNLNNLEIAGIISDAVDTGKFYVIELSSLDNLTLNYGQDYEQIKSGTVTDETGINDLENLYIINETSHNIFFVEGIEVDDEWFYTDYTSEDVDKEEVPKHTIGIAIPDGFYYVGGTKEEGIVISDSPNDAGKGTSDEVADTLEGNQFVWVPVTKNEDGTATDPYVETSGMLTKQDGTQVEIQLGRYDFNTTTGEPITIPIGYSEDTETNHNSNYGNAIARNIEKFKTSVKENGGYYIARYETGVTSDTLFDTSDMEDEYTAPNDNWTAYEGDSGDIVIKSGEKVWNYVTQKKASELCRNLKMSNGYTDVTSDLVNSYAWDTAIVFIQECGTDNNYANQVGQSTTSSDVSNAGEAVLANGTGKDKTDKQCNIYDMAGNCQEWTTETYSSSGHSCVNRGGGFNISDFCTRKRYNDRTIVAGVNDSFRPILYLED